MNITVAIADDQLLFRKGMSALIAGFDGMQVVMEAADGEDLLQQLRQTDQLPAALLLDLSMPGRNGLQTLQQLRVEFPQIGVLMLSVHEAETYIHKLISEGASAYLAKNAPPEEIDKAIRQVVQHGFYFNEATILAMRNGMQGKQKFTIGSDLDPLTLREREVLCLICQEYTSSEIAEKLFISESTVNGHRNNLLLKIGCKNTAGLVAYAFRNQVCDTF